MPTVETNGAETYYERHGAGPPIVFVHGLGFDHRLWEPQVDAFAEDYEVLTYDLRGHGKTGPTSASSYTPALLADDLRALVDRLDLDRPTVCGLSMGGSVAQTYATRHHDSLGGLVVADAHRAGRLSTPQALWRRLRAIPTGWGYRLFGFDRMQSVELWFWKLRNDASALAADGDAGGPPDPPPRSDVASYTVDEHLKLSEAGRRFLADSIEYDSISVPTLCLVGENDAATFSNAMAHVAEAIPPARLDMIAGAGHLSNWEQPDAFNARLRSFLEEVHPKAV